MEQSSDEEILAGAYKRALHVSGGEHLREDLAYYVERMSHTPGDTHATAFREGERNLALRILRLSGEIV